MKKVLSFFVLLVSVLSAFSQTLTQTFTGRDGNNDYCQLERVLIINLSKDWQETIYWPDTVMTMHVGTGIEDYAKEGAFALSQNNPNPFSGSTEASLNVAENGEVNVEISDVNGRLIAKAMNALQAGLHKYRVQIADAGVYFMTARQNAQSSTIKMVNNGHGNLNLVEYVGIGNTKQTPVQTKGSSNNAFSIGDQMEYVGYALINGEEVESQHVQLAANGSENITLQFAEVPAQLPTVNTRPVTLMTQTSVIAGGEVLADGGAPVTARGVCWSTTQNPTIANSHTTDSAGLGEYTSTMTGLTNDVTYYARAYATNIAGTAYGNEIEFTKINEGVSSKTVADVVFLPDGIDCGNGCAYQSYVVFTDFQPTATIQSANDILFARIKLEHSSIGDLYISLTCPNGQFAKILNKYGYGPSTGCSSSIPLPWGWAPTAAMNSSTADFGVAGPSDNSADKCDELTNPMGTTWNYCWSSNTTQGYQYAYGNSYVYEYGNIHNNRVDSTNVGDMTQVYRPDGSFESLIGCPMNGAWGITVIDGWGGDNGWITEWELALDPSQLIFQNIDGQPCPGADTVADVDDNKHNTVRNGDKCRVNTSSNRLHRCRRCCW